MFLRDITGNLVNIGDLVSYPACKPLRMKVGRVINIRWFHPNLNLSIIQPKVLVSDIHTENVSLAWLTRIDRIVKVNA